MSKFRQDCRLMNIKLHHYYQLMNQCHSEGDLLFQQVERLKKEAYDEAIQVNAYLKTL